MTNPIYADLKTKSDADVAKQLTDANDTTTGQHLKSLYDRFTSGSTNATSPATVALPRGGVLR